MPAQPTLLPLTEAELSELFGDDADGRRRYELLRAVLVEGMTQRQAADAGQVSERTIRNIMRAYAQRGGLEALRSRQPGGGRKRSSAALPASRPRPAGARDAAPAGAARHTRPPAPGRADLDDRPRLVALPDLHRRIRNQPKPRSNPGRPRTQP